MKFFNKISNYHDRLFKTWVEDWNRKTPEDNLRWYLDKKINEHLNLTNEQELEFYKMFPTVKKFTDDLERWYKLFKGMGIAKRVQAPPILAVSRRAFGFDYRETLGQAYFTKAYLDLKKDYV